MHKKKGEDGKNLKKLTIRSAFSETQKCTRFSILQFLNVYIPIIYNIYSVIF